MSNIRKISYLIISILMVLAVFYVNSVIKYDVPITLLCLIPISISAYLCGISYGTAVSILVLILWATVAKLEFQSGFIVTLYWDAFLLRLFLVTSVLFLVKFIISYKKEKHEGRIDYLTGLFNRRYLYELLEMEMGRCRRYKRPFTMVFFDCDNFKMLNDRRGHQGGDAALKLLAKTLKSATRATDTVARFGGDEFAILMIETDDIGAMISIDRLREKMIIVMLQNNVPLTFSFGVVTYFVPPPSINDVMKKADSLMYTAKHEGKNAINYAVYGKPIPENAGAK